MRPTQPATLIANAQAALNRLIATMEEPMQRPETDLTTAPYVDRALAELHTISHVHALAEADRDHRQNRRDATRAAQELSEILSTAPPSLHVWCERARHTAASLMADILRDRVPPAYANLGEGRVKSPGEMAAGSFVESSFNALRPESF